jgi:hypothetical protein
VRNGPGSLFKRLETDAEFRTRLRKDLQYVPEFTSGVELDEYIWSWHKRQRRIIEAEI